MALLNKIKSLLGGGKVDIRERFALLREAISGTMSKFYVAKDLRNDQLVGLKILDPQKTADAEARLKGLSKPSEGEIASRLNHPYIVKTYEYGTTTEGCQYLVMELLGGPGMNSVIVAKDRRLEGRRVEFLRQAAEALDAVHEAGYIHRDICPRNLILTEDWTTLKLTDFGLSVPATPPFMKPGNRTGTPNYMAPELVRRFPTDQRIDVFAFGVSAFEICTFQLPFASGVDGRAALSHDQPPIDIRTLRPKIHPELAAAIHSCIEADVKKRCPSMKEFLKRIRKLTKEDA
jgi:eukaryotic-like serine/threonine-protein kinase